MRFSVSTNVSGVSLNNGAYYPASGGVVTVPDSSVTQALIAAFAQAGISPLSASSAPVSNPGNGSQTPTVVSTPVTTDNSGTAYPLIFATAGDKAYDITLTGNCQFSVSGGTPAVAQLIILKIRGGAGGFTATLPGVGAGVFWPGGVLPTVDTSAGSKNDFYFRTLDGGASYSGSY